MDGRQGEIPDTNFALTRRLQALRNQQESATFPIHSN